MKRIIGIAPASFISDPEQSCADDHYKLANNYVKRVADAGCIPVCLAPSDNWLDEDALSLCDGFVVQGGAEFYPYHFQIIRHVLKTGKRYLGICLGQQAIYVYLELKRRVEARGYEGDLVKAMCDYIAEQPKDFTLQRRVQGHRYPHPKRGCEEEVKHSIDIVEGTLLHRVLGRDSIRICSFHGLCTPPEQTLVRINAMSSLGDGVVEGTEYGDNILGIQGHPEIDGLLPELFAFLAG